MNAKTSKLIGKFVNNVKHKKQALKKRWLATPWHKRNDLSLQIQAAILRRED